MFQMHTPSMAFQGLCIIVPPKVQRQAYKMAQSRTYPMRYMLHTIYILKIKSYCLLQPVE